MENQRKLTWGVLAGFAAPIISWVWNTIIDGAVFPDQTLAMPEAVAAAFGSMITITVFYFVRNK